MNSQTASAARGNLLLPGVLVLGLILAGFMGMLVGRTDVQMLTLIFGATIAVLFAVSLHRYVWHIALLLIFVGFGFRPTTFSFGVVEVTSALGFAVIALFIWQNRVINPPEVLTDRSFTFMQRVLFAWLAYVALHMFVNIKMPYHPAEFGLNNALKSYFGLSAPLLLFYYLSKKPVGISVGKKFVSRIVQLGVFGLLLNIVIYFLLAAGAWLVIPIINAGPNAMLLRTHGPLAMLLGAAVLTAPGVRNGRGAHRVIGSILLGAGSFGAILSGGRISLLVGAGLVCCVFALRRRIAALAVAVALAIVGLVVANAASGWINRNANPYVQRSVQWVLVDKSSMALESIQSSTSWRKELAARALAEWQSDPRIFWFGRATFGFGAADQRALTLAGGFEASLRTSLRRGATHNLVTDLLVAYGLVGCILYLALYFAILRWLWRLWHVKQLTPQASNLALICLLGWVGNLVFEGVGAGTMKIEMIWFMIILIGALHSGVGLAPARAAATVERVAEPALKLPGSRFKAKRQLALNRLR